MAYSKIGFGCQDSMIRNYGIQDQRIEEFRDWGIQGLIDKTDRKHSIPKFVIPKFTIP